MEYLPHDRAGPARLHLSLCGWTTIEYHVSASGAARLVYVCPVHHDWRPEDDGRRLIGMSMRDKRWLRIRRASMLWMLREIGVSVSDLSGFIGLSATRVIELVQIYDRVIARRQVEAADWNEPWARRLRAVGAIR